MSSYPTPDDADVDAEVSGEDYVDAGMAGDDCATEVPGDACAYTEYEFSDRDPEDLPATGADAEGVERDVWDALYGVDDPEMPISVVDLGLIYGVDLDDGHATVDMTLTYSGCPARTMLMDDVRSSVEAVDGVDDVDLRLVWSPEWSLDMVTEDGKETLREFGLSV